MNITRIKRNIRLTNLSYSDYFSKVKWFDLKIYKLNLTFKKKRIYFVSNKNNLYVSLKWRDKIVFSI